MATIFQRGKAWYINISENGRRVVRSLGTDERLARLRLDEVKVNLERGKAGFPVIEVKTLGRRIEEHLGAHSTGKAPKTIIRYKGIARNIMDFFGPTAQVDVAGLRRYIQHRLDQGAKSKTVNNELIYIRTIYSDNGPGSHPFRLVKNLPTRDSKEIRFLVEDEPRRLLAACSTGINRENWPDLEDYVAIYLYSGMRLGELAALAWRDVTPAGLRITNLKTFGKVRGDKYRLVPIHAELAPILARRKKAGIDPPFPPRHHNSLRRAIGRAGVRAGIKWPVGVHTLRHTFTSALLLAGVDLYTLSKLLGHSSQVTTQIYAHLQPKGFQDAVNRLKY